MYRWTHTLPSFLFRKRGGAQAPPRRGLELGLDRKGRAIKIGAVILISALLHVQRLVEGDLSGFARIDSHSCFVNNLIADGDNHGVLAVRQLVELEIGIASCRERV